MTDFDAGAEALGAAAAACRGGLARDLGAARAAEAALAADDGAMASGDAGRAPLPDAVAPLTEACAAMREALKRDAGVSEAEATAEVAAAVNVALRSQLREAGLDGADGLVSAAILLSLGTDFANAELAFLMFEDLFQTVTAQTMEAAWELLESRIRVLTSRRLMPFEKVTKAKMAMLRIANYLLRRLSASHHTVLCGRVMMFLAYAFPLSERSGVNLLGSYNEDNQTAFEDEASFEEATRSVATDTLAVSTTDRHAVNYTLYSRFWELQRFFMTRIDRPNGCARDAKKWTAFTEIANVVLTAFESNPFSQADLERESLAARASKRRKMSADSMDVSEAEADIAESKDASDARGSDSAAGFFPTKYLSSSRLLRLQLTDPTLRRNVLCQFSVLLNSLDQLRQNTGSSAVPVPLRQGLDDKTHGVDALAARVERLLRNTPPDGDGFVVDLAQILGRERYWIKWKQAKCPNFERFATDESAIALDEQDNARLRAKEGRMARAQAKVKANRQLWRSGLSKWQETLSAADANPTPATDAFMEDMEVAIDPDNCIEEDYHPKNDPAYCWRGFRLLARSSLDALEKIENGKLEDLVTHLVKRRQAQTQDKSAGDDQDDFDVKDAEANSNDQDPADEAEDSDAGSDKDDQEDGAQENDKDEDDDQQEIDQEDDQDDDEKGQDDSKDDNMEED